MTTFLFENCQQWKTCTIDPAHAGDNYIIAAHSNAGIVQRAEIDVFNDIRISISGGTSYKALTKSDMLTVWRTLWVELDRMYDPGLDSSYNVLPYQQGVSQLAMAFPPGLLAPGSHIATQLARACIVPKEFPWNAQVEVPGKLRVETMDEDMNKIRPVIQKPPYRSTKFATDTFWTVQVVSAFNSGESGSRGMCGSHYRNIIIMYYKDIEDELEKVGYETYFDTIYPIILLHELGHALWLKDVFDNNDPNDQPVPGATYGVMYNKGHNIIEHLENDNDIFTEENLKKIQAMAKSIYGEAGPNHPT